MVFCAAQDPPKDCKFTRTWEGVPRVQCTCGRVNNKNEKVKAIYAERRRHEGSGRSRSSSKKTKGSDQPRSSRADSLARDLGKSIRTLQKSLSADRSEDGLAKSTYAVDGSSEVEAFRYSVSDATSESTFDRLEKAVDRMDNVKKLPPYGSDSKFGIGEFAEKQRQKFRRTLRPKPPYDLKKVRKGCEEQARAKAEGKGRYVV